MKIEKGMYVRTKYNGIKTIDKYNYHEELPDTPYEYNKYHIYKQDVLKASHNLIDLIEVGDYVNGEKVYYWQDGILTVNEDGVAFELELIHIKSILTKEQYEANVYKIKDSDKE